MEDYANKYGFALICGEATQDVFGHGGLWDIPTVQTDATGTRCDDGSSVEQAYLKNMVKSLDSKTYDTGRLFTSGCSMGSAFSEFSGVCMNHWYGSSKVSAFATHSTGLKIKGDGNRLPPANNSTISWGECDDCQYFPIVPKKV